MKTGSVRFCYALSFSFSAKLREQKVNDAMQELEIRIRELKQAAAEDLR